MFFFWKSFASEIFLPLKKKNPFNRISIVTETTGLNLQKDQICQISAVSEGDFFGKFIETGIKIPGTLPSIGPDILPGLTGQVQCYPFDIYLRPEVEFNSKASEINGMAKVITLQEPNSL